MSNYGVLGVYRMEMENTVPYSVFYNEGTLTIEEFTLSQDHPDFDINALHSHTVIDQRGSYLSYAQIFDSVFYGSKFGIRIRFATSCYLDM